jgi:hypothetical protein
MLRRLRSTTTVTYEETASTARLIPDLSVTRGGKPFRMFRPTRVDVTVDWDGGDTVVEVHGLTTDSWPAPGWARFDLAHWNHAAHHEVRLVRDAVGQACIDHDKHNI